MAQYNTYYKKRVWDIFQHEKRKSDIVNALLEVYYRLPPEKKKKKSKD